jgi:DNA-binding NtrC family response regulator
LALKVNHGVQKKVGLAKIFRIPVGVSPARCCTLTIAMQTPPVILVVDDEESVRLLLSALLERDSYQVLLAKDGQHALEVSRQHAGEISAVVTDYKMPRMDGMQLAKAITLERPGIRVMIMSGRMSNPEALQQCGFPILSKPFTISGFLASLKRCLETGTQSGTRGDSRQS